MRSYIKTVNPNLVVSFSTPFNIISLVALFGTGVKIVISERSDPARFKRGFFNKSLRNLLYCTAEGILVQTETSKTHLWQKLAMKASVIPNPILMNEKYIGCALETEKKHLIVTVARLIPLKRLDLLIKVFSIFLVSHPNYQLIIYGEGKERDNLQKQICELGLDSMVFMPGAVEELWDKIKESEMFVINSEFEGMSNALLEAMCLGLPCISTKVSGALDVIKDGENGLLIDVNDESGLLKAMTKLAENSSLRAVMGQNAVGISHDFGLERVIDQWYDYLDGKLVP